VDSTFENYQVENLFIVQLGYSAFDAVNLAALRCLINSAAGFSVTRQLPRMEASEREAAEKRHLWRRMAPKPNCQIGQMQLAGGEERKKEGENDITREGKIERRVLCPAVLIVTRHALV
jgi:hypothetical protein